MLNNLDFTATYTLAEAKSQIGTASDELNANLLQDAELLYDDPRVYGPTSRTDARHQGSLAMVWHGQGLHHRAHLLLPVAAAGADHHAAWTPT